MRIKPILFNSEMVRAILDGRKTVTRRVVRGAWPDWSYLGLTDDAAVTAVDRYGEEYPKPVDGLWAEFEDADGPVEFPMVKTPYHPGDVLWVRETWTSLVGSYLYRADQKPGMKNPGKWRPSIHMPREAARIWLRVTDVRVEKVQDISGEDAKKEGIKPRHFDGCSACGAGYSHYPECDYEHCGNYQNFYGDWRWVLPFAELWDNTIKHADLDRYGWDANPWVWVIEFKKCEKPEKA